MWCTVLHSSNSRPFFPTTITHSHSVVCASTAAHLGELPHVTSLVAYWVWQLNSSQPTGNWQVPDPSTLHVPPVGRMQAFSCWSVRHGQPASVGISPNCSRD